MDVARLCSFVYHLAVAAPRTQLSHLYLLVSALIDCWVLSCYMLITQARMLRATENTLTT